MMKICYVVYREDNVMVFDSQVLEYLQKIKSNPDVDSVELVLFRHQQNLWKKNEVEHKIRQYVNNYKTFSSIAPPLTIAQLKVDALRLKTYIKTKYNHDDQVAVICRGDFATFIAAYAFKNLQNSRLLYDNRGLPVEESLMAHPTGKIHAINRSIKEKSIIYAKDHCDMYNFVTNSMRRYLVEKYGFSEKIPYTIIPTLYKAEEINAEELKVIVSRENYFQSDYVITYVGSAATWQSTDKLIELICKIDSRYKNVRYFILTNGKMPGLDTLPEGLKQRITVKSVPHKEMKYYLHLSNIGIVIRDDNIVNRVAAPTKIAEYLTSGIRILYSGDIGILSDLKEITEGEQMIPIDDQDEWLNTLGMDISDNIKCISPVIQNYFCMEYRQLDTIKMIKNSFMNKKVR